MKPAKGDVMQIMPIHTSLGGILEVARDVATSSDLDSMLGHIEHVARAVLDCDRVSIFTQDHETGELVSRIATGASPIRLPSDRGIAGSAFTTGAVVNAPDPDRDPRFYPVIDRATGYRTRNLLSLPLSAADGAPLGVLELINCRSGLFTRADEEIALALGALTGVALQKQHFLDQKSRARVLEEEIHGVQDVQRALLPDGQQTIEGFDVAGWSRAAGAGSGDFYDHFGLADGRHIFAVADVCGHGLAPALMATECRALVRAVSETSPDVATVMDRTNRQLHADMAPGRFVTMFLGSLDPRSATLRYASAGHLGLLHRADQRPCCRELRSTTVPLGILPALPSGPSRAAHLAPGDVVLLVTDGFYEWSNGADEPFGIERLVDAFHRYQDASASDLIRLLYDAVCDFARGADPPDDLTALVLKRGRRR